MPAQITVVTGPARCGKTERLLAEYRRALRTLPPGSVLWLAPTGRGARDVTARLMNGQIPGCFSPGVMTFAAFAEAVVQASDQPVRQLSAGEMRQLVAALIADHHRRGKLKYFAPIADTPGMVDLATDFIGNLKRLQIWPDTFRDACQRRGRIAKDLELLALYEDYQELLRRHRLYDAEGRFWSARHLLRESARPFEKLQLVVLDGFTDFTFTQHEILEILAERVKEMRISLPLDGQEQRGDLFAKSRETLARLLRLPGARQEKLPARGGDWPAMDHVERELFGHPRELRRAADTDRIQIHADAHAVSEIRWLARQIKRLLTRGDAAEAATGRKPTRKNALPSVAPHEILVVFRSATAVAPLVREVFDEYGIPYFLDCRETLQESPLCTALISVLKLAAEDWPFQQVLSVLGCGLLRPQWEEWRDGTGAAAAMRLVRRLLVPSGGEALLAAAAREEELCAARKPADDTPSATREVQSSGAAGLLRRLHALLRTLPERGTPGQLGRALWSVAVHLGFTRALQHLETPFGEQSALLERQRRTWGIVERMLIRGDEIFLEAGQAPPELDLKGYVAWLADAFRSETLPADHDDVGRVRVLSAPSARTLSAPFVFFAGLTESAFPAPERKEQLYSESELQLLREAGLPFPRRSERGEREMLLFYEVLTRATRKLWLSYPALDEKAQPLLASPYLHEVARVLGVDMPEPPLDLSPVRTEDVPLCPAEFRLHALSDALRGQRQALPRLRRLDTPQLAMLDSVLSGLAMLAERESEHFGPYQGVLSTEQTRGILEECFDPRQPISPSYLESYATCPYRFMLEHVLRVQPLEAPELETDYTMLGTWLHAALAAVHRRLRQAGKRGPTALTEQEWGQFVDAALKETAASSAGIHAESPVRRALVEIDRQILAKYLANYRAQYEKYEKELAEHKTPCEPAYFEVAFGVPPREGETLGELSTAEPLRLEHGKQKLLLRGRIDRIDVGEAGGKQFFRIVDYKSEDKISKKKREQEPDGQQLQLELYALAAQELLLPKALAAGCDYWFVKNRGRTRWQDFHTLDNGAWSESEAWRHRKQQIVQLVFRLWKGMQSAMFPVISLDENCTGNCPYHTVCRINHVRSLEKAWQPPKS